MTGSVSGNSNVSNTTPAQQVNYVDPNSVASTTTQIDAVKAQQTKQAQADSQVSAAAARRDLTNVNKKV